ncbi:sensor histidine kinase [Spongiactinospora sp. TRM90649]|uniref:sensor histidine kinase n=1 Tax=Spongiactinospora sp. TRM90649 TaxID=3031114 RepID=UPI0023F7B6AF|nr:sensor histidine kinase [Spongiactinospora sp. TRM90649]MDF5756301.1 sensor histidine kinase [Spongiactinospora sp. TRM90649]
MEPLVLVDRVPRRPARADVAVAALLAVWAVAEALVPMADPVWVAVVFALVTTLPLVVSRQAPLAVLAVVTLALVARAATAAGPPATVAPFPSLLVAAFSVALHVRSLPWALGGWAATVSGMAAAIELRFYPHDSRDVGSALIMVFFVTGAWTAGRLLRSREVRLHESEERVAERARQAVAAERLRIARELHDVVAHSLSIIAVNAGAAVEVGRHDSERARAHLDAVATTAREALAEMRHVLEALRGEDDDALAPQPTLDRLPELVEQARAGGLPVRLSVRGQRRTLPPGVELTAYRVAQEALTNVRRHAGPAETEVRLTYGTAELDLEVTNDAPPGRADAPLGDGPGHGLVGMRERARLYGGALHAGPSGHGGYRVRLSLPVEAK